MNESKKDISIPMKEAANKSLLIAIPIAVFQAASFFLIHGVAVISNNTATSIYGFLLLFGILAHELIHVFTWALLANKPLKAFKLGFQWKSLTPYAHCKEPMAIQPYRIGSFAPGLLLGILPWLISLFIGNFLLFLFGLLYTTAAGGDFLILWIIRNIKSYTLVEDHPVNTGCYVIEQPP
jgi:Putative zincin peptidase